ncbi:hypothetical protein NECAME_14318 [Necator americanus]|uniref:Uncharacterized protein n=1 Tax=Necator americanus TaxID=51031 RepID=W2SNM2_NECAM|nr:hypothetical protein NECAME_14318 [Necator americanus]ETN71264.1 hypothetical protein NECAME_14318 [Necator americanus]
MYLISETFGLRKSGSAHSNLCAVQQPPEQNTPRMRREKPPPPVKPQDLAQRAMAWSQCSQPGPSTQTELQEREPSTTREQTNRTSVEVSEVPTASSTPTTSRNSRPRLAPPPPPPPKKPARLIPRGQSSDSSDHITRYRIFTNYNNDSDIFRI